jgi:hypothetical protein
MNSPSIAQSAAPAPESSGEPSTSPTKKPKRVSTLLTLAPNPAGRPVKFNLAKHADQERFLENLAACWHRKLKELKPQIKAARDLFRKMERGTTLCGCSSFMQFCDEKLHVTRQGVYKMLGDYDGKRKARQAQETGSHRRPPKPLSKHDQRRRDDVTVAVLDLVEAQERGDADAEARAREDIRILKQSGPSSALFENYGVRQEVLALKKETMKLKKLVLQLLGEIRKTNKRDPLPVELMQAAAALETELAVDAKSLGLDAA